MNPAPTGRLIRTPEGRDVNIGDVGPGWEYYLDNLVASRTGGPLPNFNDYYPSQRTYYLELAAGES